MTKNKSKAKSKNVSKPKTMNAKQTSTEKNNYAVTITTVLVAVLFTLTVVYAMEVIIGQ